MPPTTPRPRVVRRVCRAPPSTTATTPPTTATPVRRCTVDHDRRPPTRRRRRSPVQRPRSRGTTGNRSPARRADGRQVCLVGPAGGTGEVFQRGSAEADPHQDRAVGRHRRPPRRRRGVWNAARLASAINGTQLVPDASVGDRARRRVIQSAPTVQQPNFTGSVQITGKLQRSRGAQPGPGAQQRRAARSSSRPQAVADRVADARPGLAARRRWIAGLVGVGLVLDRS